MKGIALIVVLVVIALVVNAQEQSKGSKATPTNSPEKPGSVSVQPGTTTQATPKSEKPYGCYKDLKWGMSFEQAQSSLGIKLKKLMAIIGPEKGKTNGYTDVTIGDKIYTLQLWFDSTGLYKVRIDPKELGYVKAHKQDEVEHLINQSVGLGTSPNQAASILVNAYFLFRPTLEEKFGKPIKESSQDRGSDVVLSNNLLAHQAIISSTWETEESNIYLTAECTGRGTSFPDKDRIVFSPFLVYEKKNLVPKAKVDL